MARIMVIIPHYDLFPPRGGGRLRCFHLLQELSREHEVHALILQPEKALLQPRDGYQFPESLKVYGPAQVPPPKTIFDHLPRKLGSALHYRWLQRSWANSANSFLLETHHLIHQILMQEIDVVILNYLTCMQFTAPLIKRLRPQAIRILDTHNVNHHLLAQAIQNCNHNKDERKSLQKDFNHTRWCESHLDRFVHAYFACSDEDRDALKALNRRVRGFTIPNGVDIAVRPFDDRPAKSMCRHILFCGSLSSPANRDGLLWFHERIWPLILRRCPDVRLVVIGRALEKGDFGKLRADPTIDFIGEVEDVVPYYHRTGISVVPLRMGSGTRLKILEAMSLGNPVVSTRIGAEGIGAVHGKHLMLADEPVAFAETVETLLADADLFEAMRRQARQFVEAVYDWRAIAKRMSEAIEESLQARSLPGP